MTSAMILQRDLSGDPANGYVSKILLKIDEGYGCYSLEFANDVELATNLRMLFLQSRWFDEIDAFIGEALRLNAEFIPLRVPDEEVIRFVRRNRERLGRHSRPLFA
jgi:hypothetical protein